MVFPFYVFKLYPGGMINCLLFVHFLTEVIDWMVKNKMEVDAVDIAYTCGIEDQINPQKLLISFLRESKESSNKRKKAAQGSPAAVVSSLSSSVPYKIKLVGGFLLLFSS